MTLREIKNLQQGAKLIYLSSETPLEQQNDVFTFSNWAEPPEQVRSMVLWQSAQIKPLIGSHRHIITDVEIYSPERHPEGIEVTEEIIRDRMKKLDYIALP